MVGRILLIALCVILVLLATALLVPAYVRVSYDRGELRAFVKYAWLTIPLYPGGEQAAKEETTEAAKQPQKTAPKEKRKANRSQIKYTLETLPAVLAKALKRTGRRIRIEPLKLHILVATGDPADTAVLYGKLEGALEASLPVLHRLVRIREQDIRLFPDFCEEQMDCIADVGIGIRPLDLLVIALCAMGGVVKWLVGYKKRAENPAKTETKQTETTTQTEKAA